MMAILTGVRWNLSVVLICSLFLPMIGGQCCTIIPNNIASEGSITKALQGLTTLANELAENSGMDDLFNNLLEQWFRKWKSIMVSSFTSLIIVLVVMITVGCCIILCIMELVQSLIETAFTKETFISYQNNLFLLDTTEHECQLMLTEFEENNKDE
jgi:uncharacterized membrane protein